MERRRIEYPGAFYHVIQRGNNRENIFRRDNDKQYYLDNLVSLKKKLDFNLLGYVLMDNHYHLLLQTGEDPLHKVIFRQNMFYSRYFNKTHQRTGHLYGDRYKASIIQDESYLFSVLRYIHWNPVRAGLCVKLSDYRWSSDSFYRENLYGTVDIDFILNVFNANRKAAIAEYVRLMAVEDDTRYDSLKIIGDEPFVESLKKEDAQEEHNNRKRRELADVFADSGANDEEKLLIKTGSRKRHLTPFKLVFIEEAVRQGYSYRDIGEFINITDSAVALYRKPEIT